MNSKKIYLTLVVLFISLTMLIILTRTKEPEFSFKERNAAVANSAEWINAKSAIQTLLVEIRQHPENIKAKLNLVLAYIQESRVTGDHAYYDAASLKLIEEILSKEKNNFQALCAKATVLLSQHHFSDALEVGKNAIEINPYNSYGYGILTDANVELGKYNEAIKMADKMVAVRPDMRSYSRVSYLREILGDYNGAIEAMKMAVESGLPGSEQTEWARTYLGKLYETTGNLTVAEMQYKVSLSHRPDYPYAYAGLGRIEKAKRNYKGAIQYFNNAKNILKDYSFHEELADLYRLTIQPQKASDELYKAVQLLGANSGNEKKNIHGHYSDRELALVYIDAYRYDLALQHALTEYNRRPENIDVNQTLAWVRFKRGEYQDAENKINIALKTNSQNPVLLYEAGLIKASVGKTKEGITLLKRSENINPHVPIELVWERSKILTKQNQYAAR
jgi:tetratricopeptide (TPR) repeat protein